LEQRRWQKDYCSYPGDGNVRRHRPWSTNARVWALRLASDHVVQHDGFHSFCCSSKSKNKNESVREIKIDPFFPDELLALDEEDWSLCMASSLFFLK
jgi:hypothetical protein